VSASEGGGRRNRGTRSKSSRREGARRLVEELAATAPRFSPLDRRVKLRLLRRLTACPIQQADVLRRLHEALCLLQAYPDDASVLAAVDRELARIPARVRLLGNRAAALHDSGIAGSTLGYTFGFPMARWLVSRFGAQVDVAWERFDDAERLEDVLSVVVHHAENDALTDFGLDWRSWLSVARGGRRLTDLQLFVELFERAPLSPDVRDSLFDSLELPIVWRLHGPGGSRTSARLPGFRAFYAMQAIARPTDVDVLAEIERPLPSLRSAPRPLARDIVEAARLAMATRHRELYGFSYANLEDVLVAEPGRGLRIGLIGILPEFRLPFETFYGYLVLRNGVPVGYGGAWHLFGTLWFGINIFESFRGGESLFIATQALRVFRHVLGVRDVALEPFQVGDDNPEALASGAFHFYYRLGFRPLDPALARLAEREHEKRGRDSSYRSPSRALKRLARADMHLSLTRGRAAPGARLKAAYLAALVTDHIARRFHGDRGAAAEAIPRQVARALRLRRWTAWRREEREAFERLSLLAAVVPGLARWPAAAKGHLAHVLRAKGARSETDYARQLDAHLRFRRSLEALVRRLPAGGQRKNSMVGTALTLSAAHARSAAC
jgi:hypothetical protein